MLSPTAEKGDVTPSKIANSGLLGGGEGLEGGSPGLNLSLLTHITVGLGGGGEGEKNLQSLGRTSLESLGEKNLQSLGKKTCSPL